MVSSKKTKIDTDSLYSKYGIINYKKNVNDENYHLNLDKQVVFDYMKPQIEKTIGIIIK